MPIKIASLEKWRKEEIDHLERSIARYGDKHTAIIASNINQKFLADLQKLYNEHEENREKLAQQLENLQFMFGPQRPEYY